MQEIIVAVVLFTGIIMALAVMILLARSRLVPSGDITINVNGERDIAVPAGGKLLNALTANALFLPSACGGGGTCGQCRLGQHDVAGFEVTVHHAGAMRFVQSRRNLRGVTQHIC